MQAVSIPPRQARTHYRHELRTLTYVTLDEANGGIIRNLSHEGVAVQAVAPLHLQQRVRLHFDLRSPRVRVETSGEVCWARSSGQCGIRFVDLPARTGHQINEWIFSNLLDALARDASHPRSISGASIFGASVVSILGEDDIGEENSAEESDGLTVSPSPRPAIRLAQSLGRRDEAPVLQRHSEEDFMDAADDPYAQSWLSQPLSGRTLAWLVDGLIVVAGLLLFALIFLSIAHELPPWSVTLGAFSAAAAFIVAAYWGVFAVFGGPSLGARLARAASRLQKETEEEEDAVRIR
ncbi:MAG: PilZ domain-containing protein [Candidatus Sulfotelmatobacter sp.]